MKNWILLSLTYGLIAYLPISAIAYDDQITHPGITNKAVRDVSGLDAYVKTTLGLARGVNSRFPSDSQDPSTAVIELLKKGSTDEDKELCRRANHMHNPMNWISWNDSYMSDDPWWASLCSLTWVRRYSNITWATAYTEPAPDGAKITLPFNPTASDKLPFTWDWARISYYNALGSSAKETRELYFAETFTTLGHVLHLLQDMAVPAHTRNDFTSHLTLDDSLPLLLKKRTLGTLLLTLQNN